MDLLENPGKILEMLAKNEEAAGQLYAAYADKFLKMRDFWLDMAEDEKTHAVWIRILRDMAVEGRLAFKKDGFDITSVSDFTNHIKNEIVKTTRGLDLNYAFSVAVSIEESLIDSKYFEAVDTDNSDLKKTLKDLEMATREHAQKLRETLEAHRK